MKLRIPRLNLRLRRRAKPAPAAPAKPPASNGAVAPSASAVKAAGGVSAVAVILGQNPPAANGAKPASLNGGAAPAINGAASSSANQPATPKRAPKPVEPMPRTLEEFQQAAREETPLLRFFGFSHSGIFNRSVMKRRWLHHQAFFGGFPWMQHAIIWGISLFVIASVTAFIFFVSWSMYDPRAAEAGTRMARNPIIDAGIACAMISVATLMSMELLRLRLRWTAMYCDVFVFECADKLDEWKTTGMLQTVAPRLAFIDPAVDYFTGPTRSAGPRRGVVNLTMEPGQRLTDLKSYRDIFDLAPAKSDFTEVTARQIYDVIADSAEAGEMERDADRSKYQKLVGQHWPWVCLAVSLIVMLFQASG